MAGGLYPTSKSFKRSSQSLVYRDALSRRAIFIMLLITTLMGGAVYRLMQLQIFWGEHNRQLAEQNRIRFIPIPADRGNIVDRNGQKLAANRLSRAVYLWPRQQSPQEWQVTAARLQTILNVPASEIIARLEQTGYDSPLPVRINNHVSRTAFIQLAEQSSKLPGVEIIAGATRIYPHRSLAAHVIGYIGEATAEDMRANPEYPIGMIVGQMGVERLANKQLQGVWGSRLVEVDARGKESQLLGSRNAIGGTDVQLTLDLRLQQAAERALNGRRGAVAALDVKTGAVLVLASSPTFDPTLFTGRMSQADWKRLQENNQPLLNRAMQGYPPGSTFKVVTAVAGMESGQFSPTARIGTSAFISVGGIRFWEHSNHGYGAIGFRKALAVSSNTFFYRIGMTIGAEAIAKWGNQLGIGSTSHMGLQGGTKGVIPTPALKETQYGEPWYLGDTVSTSIGQGLVQASPLELAVMVAAIANGGQRVQPHLLASETGTEATRPQPTGIKPETINAVRSGLIAAVQEGTARRLNDGVLPLTAGKTGTAEVAGPKPHALFVGYGPVSNPEIAIAVVVENGGYGGVAALPVAKEVYKAYFQVENQEGKE